MAINFTDFLNAPQSQSPFASALQGLLSGLDSADAHAMNKSKIALNEANIKYLPDILKAKLGLLGAQTSGANAAAGASNANAGLHNAQAKMFSQFLSGNGDGSSGAQPQSSDNSDITESGGGKLGAAVVPEGVSLDDWIKTHDESGKELDKNKNKMPLEKALLAAAFLKLKTETGKDSQGNKILITPFGKYRVEDNPLTASQKAAHQKTLGAIENVLPMLKELSEMDIPNQLVNGITNPNKNQDYNSKIIGTKDALMTAMNFPQTNEGFHDAEKLIRMGKLETLDHYRKRIKKTMAEIRGRGKNIQHRLGTGANYNINEDSSDGQDLSDPLGIR